MMYHVCFDSIRFSEIEVVILHAHLIHAVIYRARRFACHDIILAAPTNSSSSPQSLLE